MAIRRDNTIQTPNLGLYLGVAPTQMPRRGMVDCLNVRIKQGKVLFDSIGWSAFPSVAAAINLDLKPVLLIESFPLRNGSVRTVFGNTTDLFQYDDVAETVAFLTPRYEVGTALFTNGSAVVTGTGTLWNTASNAKPGDFISAGATETDPLAVWYEILTVDSDTQVTLTANFAQVTTLSIPYTIRKTFTGLVDDPWFTETFYNGSALGGPATTGDRMYFTNGIDAVVAWDGAADVVYTPALGNVDTCRDIIRHKNKLIYFVPTVGGSLELYSIRTSDIGKPEDTVNGEAAELIVYDGPDELIAIKLIGEQIALYGKASVTLAQSVSLPLIYVFRTVVNGYGPISTRGVAVYPDFHDFVGRDRQYRFNGATIMPVNDHVWRDVLRRIPPIRNGYLLNHFDEERGELLWVTPLTTDAIPETGPPEICFTNHYMEDVGERSPDPFTRRELPALTIGSYARQTTLTWDQIAEQWQDFSYRWNDKFFFEQFPLTLFGDINGNIFTLNASTAKAGVLMDSFVRFARVSVGSIESNGIVKRIYPFIEQVVDSVDTVTVTLFGAKSIDGAASLLSAQNFQTGFTDQKIFVSPRASTRYAEVQVGIEQARNYWALSGYAIDTAPGSAR